MNDAVVFVRTVASGCFQLSAVCVAVEIGLFRSLVLSTLTSPSIVFASVASSPSIGELHHVLRHRNSPVPSETIDGEPVPDC